MSKVICVAGESGSGKTTSMRNLDPETTYYIDCDKKGLSWKGWKGQYRLGVNYIKTDMPSTVRSIFNWLDGKKPVMEGGKPKIGEDGKPVYLTNGLGFKTVIIDTINGIMIADEMRRSKEKGYDKWTELAQCIYDIIDDALTMRDDLTVIFIAHSQTERDDSGYMFTRIKCSGKKLEKMVLESKFTTVLLAKSVDGKYMFETQARNSTAKSPMGAFEEFEIENDIIKVISALDEF